MREPADSVQDLPDGDRRDAESLAGDLVEKRGNARLRLPPHHLGDDVGVDEPRNRNGHVPPSPENDTGR